MLQVDQILLFVNILQKLHQQNDEEGIYKFVLDEMIRIFNAPAGTLYMANVKTASLIPVSSVGVPIEKLKNLPFKFGLGICGWVAQSCESIIINDPEKDERFTDLYDRATGFKTKNILCAPLMAHGECLGVIEIFNRTDRPFLNDDLIFLDMLGNHMAIALENSVLYKRLNRLNAFSTSLLSCLPSGFAAVDNDGIVTHCNQKAEAILKLEWNAVGSSIEVAFRKIPAFLAVLQVAIKERLELSRQEIVIQSKTGNMLIGYNTFLIRSETNALEGRGIIFQDITAYQSKAKI